MFSRVVHKTKHRCVFQFFSVLLCSSDPSVRHVKFWDTEQAVMQGLLLSNGKNVSMLKEDIFCLKMLPCILALEANSRLGHIFFPQYRPASSLEPTWNSVAAGLRCPQFGFF